MTRAVLLACLLSGGCLIVPANKSTTRALDNEFGDPAFVASGEVSLTAASKRKHIVVTANRSGQCTRPVFAHSEVTTTKRMKLGGASDPRAMIFGAIVAPITIPVSFLISGLVVANASPETKEESKPIGTQTYACTLVAGQLPVQMTLPSGAIVRGTTDLSGSAVLEVPATEQFVGSATIAAAGAKDAIVQYSLPRPPFVVAREVVTECAKSLSGLVEVKLSISEDGRATNVWLSSGDDQIRACVSERLGDVVFPERAHGRTVKMPVTI